MRFAQRNIFYLRASSRVVLQTVLHIDPRHLRWMNSKQYTDGVVGEDDDDEGDGTAEDPAEIESTGDDVFARALSGLRTKIMPKLQRESIEGKLLSSTNKKANIDILIEKDFQMAYFFKNMTGKHAVLLKEKNLIFPQREMGPPGMSASAMRSYQNTSVMPPSRLAARQRRDQTNIVAEGEAIAEERSNGPSGTDAIDRATAFESDHNASASSNGVRKRRNSSPELGERHVRVKQEDEDVEIVPSSESSAPEREFEWTPTPTQPEERPETITIEDTIDDKKPKLDVSYSGFQIFGKCLVLVIEPTKRTRRNRPGLFQEAAPKEKSQLSATPVPEGVGEAMPSARAPSRLASATPGAGRRLDLDRADSRRLTTPSAGDGALFRGTPSDWEPTPPPASRRGSTMSGLTPYRRQSEAAEGLEDVQSSDDDEEAQQEDFNGARLASQMLEDSHQSHQGNDLDDD